MNNLTVEDALQEIRKIVGPYPQIIVDVRDCGQETRGPHGQVEYSAQIGMNGEQYAAATIAGMLAQVHEALRGHAEDEP